MSNRNKQKKKVMKTVNIEIENGKEVELTVDYSSKQFAGSGHYKLQVDLSDDNGNDKSFFYTTTDMELIDSLDEMSSNEKDMAIYNHVKYMIEEEVIEWLRDSI